MREVARQHSLSRNLLRLWVEKYEAGQLTDEVADAARIAEYEAKVAALERKVGQLTMEVDLLKKERAGNAAERRELLHRERPGAISVAGGCRIMKLARSTYYYRSRRSAAEKMALQRRIDELSTEFPRYGYRRVTYQLRAEGLLVNHKAVARIMRQSGLQVRPLRRFVRTTRSDNENPIFPNLAQGIDLTGPRPIVGGRPDVRRDHSRLCVPSRRSRRLVAPGIRAVRLGFLPPGR
jgi:transposase-like protein